MATSVADLSTNSINREFAFEQCAAQVDCIIAWFNKETVTCGKSNSDPPLKSAEVQKITSPISSK